MIGTAGNQIDLELHAFNTISPVVAIKRLVDHVKLGITEFEPLALGCAQGVLSRFVKSRHEFIIVRIERSIGSCESMKKQM
jgi:hypothetical protein